MINIINKYIKIIKNNSNKLIFIIINIINNK